MNRFFFVCGICVLLGAGCGSSPSAVPSATTTPTVAPTVATQVAPNGIATAPIPATTAAQVASDAPEDIAIETLLVSMTSGNFFFDPATLKVSPGQDVSISIVSNEGTHTFVIEEIGLKKQMTTGAVVTFTAPTTPGSYAYYCDVGAHRKLGMEGVLIVK